MCTVSNIMDDWRDRLTPRIDPWVQPTTTVLGPFVPSVSPQEFEAFKEEMRKEFKAMRKLIKAAKIYDEETGQGDCENDEKIALFKQLANLIGVDISDIFPDKVVQP